MQGVDLEFIMEIIGHKSAKGESAGSISILQSRASAR
jgi:hypothetical protein